jgi:2-polyprenyl-3-methyl-5-hydroxy-6-metoxy-1,4-benzoquinol methylase
MARALLTGAGFFAWHFVLRRGGVRLETRFSARLYAAVVMAWEAVRRRDPFMPLLAALPLAFGLRQPKHGARAHFDDLAPDYAEQLSPAARERVVRRKTALMVDALAGAAIKSPRILDVGCGHGWYIDALRAEGASVTGIDLAPAQLTAARAHLAGNAALAAGSVLQLPVAPRRFDAAYAVNVLHHLEDEALQAAALDELAQAVRPGGLIFVHEINTRNPLFSFYMSYVFPLWKRIDRGTERWLDPHRLPVSHAVTLEDVRCYTFLPDFAPHSLVTRLGPLEHALEHAIPSWSAHFTAVFRRLPSA